MKKIPCSLSKGFFALNELKHFFRKGGHTLRLSLHQIVDERAAGIIRVDHAFFLADHAVGAQRSRGVFTESTFFSDVIFFEQLFFHVVLRNYYQVLEYHIPTVNSIPEQEFTADHCEKSREQSLRRLAE